MRILAWVLSLGLLAGAVPVMAQAEAEAEAPASPAVEAAEPVAEPAAEAPKTVGEVARAMVTSGISEREPVDELAEVAADAGNVYFFTELRGMQGQQVVHRWVYNDQVMAEVPFNVNGQRWRVWSSKTLKPEWTGTWSVSVVAGNGEVLVSRQFQFGAQ